ncbi:hypothetical protein JRC04_21340 [Mycolicibacterium sp. S2-37]|uniref:type VII secretion target n=1 Tax=Mycolicibacterium sp. S2-37 TaxID=2810297 RepID=UPI001A94897F|nr:type VII secretion target [Mycolicibacterium sp. S2-37]MBO0680021.1 hypothetical protein [Mycolicibacterium sp. S2-37]
MAEPLQVNPDDLRSAASCCSEVGDYLRNLGTGRALGGAAAAVAGSASAACDHAATVLDRITTVLAGDLATHSARLIRAADLYTRADEDIARCVGCR